MFQLIQGASIPDVSGLREAYQLCGDKLYANVSAENIPKVFEAFLLQMREDEPLFLFIEAPCSEDDERKLNPPEAAEDPSVRVFHRDVYYLDGYDREDMLLFLRSGVGELLINDGLVFFGFGSLDSNVELGKYQYHALVGHLSGQESARLAGLFDALGIPCVPQLVTAWDLFSEENPGTSRKYRFNGKDVYDLIEEMTELGLYKAETREEA